MIRYTLISLGALLLIAGVTMAQEEAPCSPMMASALGHPCTLPDPGMMHMQRPGGGHGGMGGDWHGKRKHLEQLRMLKLLEFLDLDEEQEVAFLTGFKKMRDEEQRLDSLRRVEVEKLAGLVENDDAADAAIETQSQRVIELQKQRMETVRTSLIELGEQLTPRQKAKLLIFHDRFEYEILKRVNEFQRRRGMTPETPGEDSNIDNQ